MRSTIVAMVLFSVVSGGCGGGGHGTPIALPRVYPPVRATTPTALIADPKYAGDATVSGKTKSLSASVKGVSSALGSAINLASAVQDRLYTPGPTEILRIVQEIDDRAAQLDTDPSSHSCLTSTPTALTYALPGGQSFTVMLQCSQTLSGPDGKGGGGWLAFGFANALDADGGVAAVDGGSGTDLGGNDFYLIEGQANGMGGAYHVNRTTGNVEGWIAVADSSVPNNSQVIMHLLTDQTAGTLELALAGSGVGFCSAHLKTGGGFLFINGKTNGAPDPGTVVAPGTQYCDAARTGCFSATALDTDLGGDDPSCAAIAPSSFGIGVELDASTDAGANVTSPTIYTYFNQAPTGVPAF